MQSLDLDDTKTITLEELAEGLRKQGSPVAQKELEVTQDLKCTLGRTAVTAVLTSPDFLLLEIATLLLGNHGELINLDSQMLL